MASPDGVVMMNGTKSVQYQATQTPFWLGAGVGE